MNGVGADASGWTTSTLILIAVGMVLAVLVILWGMRNNRVRKAGERTVAAESKAMHGEVAAVEPATPLVGETPVTPPVAPAPPPLAGNDVPVVAAAPFEASPAALAADLATPPAEPAGADDLTQLKGVGPKLAVRLGELGVSRFAQIADLSAADADALDAQLGAFKGRLERDRWIEQANYLARGDRDGFEAAFGRL